MRSVKSLAVVVVLIAAALLVYFNFIPRKHDEGILRFSGTIEATEVDVSFQIGGRVAEVVVREGQTVQKDEVVARMSAEETQARVSQTRAALDAVSSLVRQQEATLEMRRGIIEKQIEQAASQVEAARIAVDRLRRGTRPEEVRVAEAAVAQATAEVERRRTELQRITALVQSDLAPKRDLDTAQSAALTADANLAAAREQLALAREGPRKEDISEAEARVRTAEAARGIAEAGRKDAEIQQQALESARARARELQAQLEGTKTQLGYNEIRSPLSGVVLTKNVESGEVVNPGTPVLTIGDVDDLWMNIYVPETKTGLVKLGQPVKVRVDSFPGEQFDGKITFISSQSEFTPKTIQTEEERIKLVFRVKVGLANSEQRLKPGMPADAEIDIR